MQLARVVGTVVSTRKDPRVEGMKLLIVKLIRPDGVELDDYQVAVDTVDAGFGEVVLMAAGSSARMAEGCGDRPVDRSIVGVVDTIDFLDGELPARLKQKKT
ncbi:MAG TPA: EutN/CcmL family microcompartment protein [Acidobacteriota bacterium]|nr:EutN/CcmL family microcompartment protein [Acidobacteriota bacterium]